jgi:lysozyme
MQISTNGLNLIKREEGFRADTYADTAGFLTVGFGHKLVLHESYPGGITEEQASTMLSTDVQTAEAAVSRLVTVALTQNQFDALVDFTFNLGAGRLASSTLLKVLNAGKYAAAANELLLWDHSGGVEVEGLKLRREAEYQLFIVSA